MGTVLHWDGKTWTAPATGSSANLYAVWASGPKDVWAVGELRTVLDGYSAPPLALYAVYPPTRHLSVKVRLFIDFLVERFVHEEDIGVRTR